MVSEFMAKHFKLGIGRDPTYKKKNEVFIFLRVVA